MWEVHRYPYPLFLSESILITGTSLILEHQGGSYPPTHRPSVQRVPFASPKSVPSSLVVLQHPRQLDPLAFDHPDVRSLRIQQHPNWITTETLATEEIGQLFPPQSHCCYFTIIWAEPDILAISHAKPLLDKTPPA